MTAGAARRSGTRRPAVIDPSWSISRGTAPFVGRRASRTRVPSPDDLVDMTGKLCDAARNGDVVKLRELLDAGADVCRGDYDCSATGPSTSARRKGTSLRSNTSSRRGADVNAVDRWRGTIRDAEAGEHTETVAFCVGHAVVLTSRRWRGGHDSAVAETRRDNLISTQVAFLKAGWCCESAERVVPD